MKAFVITKPGDADVFKEAEVPTPAVESNQVKVKVKATAVNRADILQRQGLYPAPPGYPQNICGLEFAGVVEEVGPNVEAIKPGDRVFGLVGSGSYAEYVVVHEKTLCHMPANLSFTEAAAMPEAFITAYDAMVLQGKLQAGNNVLISAVGSGVGTAAVQIAQVIGASSFGTSRTQEKLEPALALGLTKGIVAAGTDFAKQVLRDTAGSGVDVVLELVGGAYVAEDIKCMAERGRLIVVGLLAGPHAEIDLRIVLHKRLEIRGTTLRGRAIEEKIAVMQAFDKEMVPHIAEGRLKPVIDRVMPIAQVAEAHRYMEANTNFGKVVLEM